MKTRLRPPQKLESALFFVVGLFFGQGCLCAYGAILGRFLTIALILILLRFFIAHLRAELTWKLLGTYTLIYALVVVGGYWLMTVVTGH